MVIKRFRVCLANSTSTDHDGPPRSVDGNRKLQPGEYKYKICRILAELFSPTIAEVQVSNPQKGLRGLALMVLQASFTRTPRGVPTRSGGDERVRHGAGRRRGGAADTGLGCGRSSVGRHPPLPVLHPLPHDASVAVIGQRG